MVSSPLSAYKQSMVEIFRTFFRPSPQATNGLSVARGSGYLTLIHQCSKDCLPASSNLT